MAAADTQVDELAAALEPSLPGRVERDAPLAGLTTYRVGGAAAVLVRARREGDLAVVAAGLRRFPQPLLIIGRGSNLLVADAGFAGLVLLLEGEFEEITTGESVLTVGGAVALPVLARRAAAAGLTGLEFYVGIPGTVGGAIRMNAGGHGRETREVLRSARHRRPPRRRARARPVGGGACARLSQLRARPARSRGRGQLRGRS